MDLQSDCYAYNQNMMLISSIDPLVNENFSQFHESVTEMEQQFSQGTSSADAQDCFQFGTEEEMSDWSVDGLPMFPDMQMFPNFVSIDENNQQVPMVDELRQESELTHFSTNYQQLQQASESTKLPMTDEQLQLESAKLTNYEQLQQASESTKLPMTDEQLQLESAKLTNYEQLQQASESTKLPMTDEQLQLESAKLTNYEQLQQASESTKLPMTDEQLQLESAKLTNYEQLQQASESTKLPMTDEQFQLKSKQTQMLRKKTKKRSIKNSTHEYNTRNNAYKKSIEEFLKAQSKITEEARKKSCPPRILKTHAEGQWIYPKDRAQIVLLKCDIKPIKHPNYVQKRKYRSTKNL